MKSKLILFTTLIVGVFVFSLTASAMTLIASLDADCENYTITVSGVSWVDLEFSYSLTLSSGGVDVTTVAGDFIAPWSGDENNKTYNFSLTGSWGVELCGDYSVSGYVEMTDAEGLFYLDDSINTAPPLSAEIIDCECDEPGGTCDAHTIGFWKNNIRKAIQGKTRGIQIDRDTILSHLEAINGFSSEFEFVFTNGDKASENAALREAYDILSGKGQKTKDKVEKAIVLLKKQLLAAELNYANGSFVEGGGAATLEFIMLGEAMILDPGTPAVILALKDSYDDFNNNVNCFEDPEDPPEDPGCGCRGKVTQLTLQYNGGEVGATITVVQKKEGLIFSGTVNPGGQFTIVGTDKKNTLGTEISIFVNGNENTKIHTSCSQPIGPGLVKGDFEVIEGYSREGGLLCRIQTQCATCPGGAGKIAGQAIEQPELIPTIQNYPNPFNPVTTLSFTLPEPGFVTLTIYNALGAKVATLAERDFSAGVHAIEWNANEFSSGIYFYRIVAGSFVETKKMMFMK